MRLYDSDFADKNNLNNLKFTPNLGGRWTLAALGTDRFRRPGRSGGRGRGHDGIAAAAASRQGRRGGGRGRKGVAAIAAPSPGGRE